MPTKKRALLSVSDKTGLAEFGRRLVDLGYELVSTGGTLSALLDAGVDAVSVSDITDFPEILGGRVKTLHPNIFAGILARRALEDDLKTIDELGLGLVDVVVVNLYPFKQTVAAAPDEFDACVEKIDIGGPSLLRAAAKAMRDVMVVVDAADYGRVADALASDDASLKLRQELAVKVFQHTSGYDAAIANYLAERPAPKTIGETVPAPEGDEFPLPAQLFISVPRASSLRYGENPHQAAALYADDGPAEPSGPTARQLQGKELSYNNINDGEGALELAREMALLCEDDGRAAVAIIKHSNPCGAALGATVAEAYQSALACDPVSAFGSIIALNRELDAEAAEEMKSLFVEAILAPSYSKEALEILSKKKMLRLLETGPIPGPMNRRRAVKSVVGGYLVQELDRMKALTDLQVVTEKQPSPEDLKALAFAWTVVKTVKSNAIVYTSETATLGIGAGQMSRVDAAKIGADKARQAGLSLKGSYLASDAFFPFRDGVDVAAEAGVKAIIQPGGSKRDDETIAAANDHGMIMVFTGRRHFRH